MKTITSVCGLVLLTAMATSGPARSQAQTGSEDAEVLEEIRVTGSRIVRKDYSSSSPVVTIPVDQLEEFGAVTVEQTLNTLPQFTEGASAGTLSIGGGVGATLNMRALGSTRNLVLMDQRRLPVVNQFGVVDTNIVPIGILQGVEVLTGGASSVYGSEAISGVVNFQSVDYFEGINLNAEYGDAFDGGADVTNLSAI